MILWYKIVGLIELWVCCLWRVNRITHFVIGGCFIVCLRGCCCATELCFGRMKDPFFFNCFMFACELTLAEVPHVACHMFSAKCKCWSRVRRREQADSAALRMQVGILVNGKLYGSEGLLRQLSFLFLPRKHPQM